MIDDARDGVRRPEPAPQQAAATTQPADSGQPAQETQPLPAIRQPEARVAPEARPAAQERDHRLLHHGRKRRAKRQAKRKRQQNLTIAVLTAVVVIASAIGIGALAKGLGVGHGSSAAAHPKAGLTARPWAVTTSVDFSKLGNSLVKPDPVPTPIFASWGNLDLHLPVPAKKLNEVGFHQASYTYSLHMDTQLKCADDTTARRRHGTGGHKVVKDGDETRLTGYYLRMWRARPGKPDTAADVGALPGTPVIAPVSGTVVRIRHYKLYGRVADWELHIRPDDNSRVDLVVIHIDNVKTKVGAHVEGGLTQIAEVRKISGIIDSQLNEFTRTGGDHTHIQLNDTWRKDYKGLELRDAPGLAPFPG